MERITLTLEMLQAASDYIPLVEKTVLAAKIAQKCVVNTKITYQENENSQPLTVPDRAQEMTAMTQMCLMGVLVKKYLGIDCGTDDDMQMPANLYDNWAGSHIINQLERMKGNKAVSEKVYNLLYDYRELRWMVNREIESLVEHRNDMVMRLNVLMTETTTPEALQNAVEQLRDLQDKVASYKPEEVSEHDA